jgi:hypothetical protein
MHIAQEFCIDIKRILDPAVTAVNKLQYSNGSIFSIDPITFSRGMAKLTGASRLN